MTDQAKAPATRRRRRWLRPQTTLLLALLAVLALLVLRIVVPQVQFILATTRSSPVYSPPVVAGQKIIWCTGGFYAREGNRPVLLYSAHCADPGTTVKTMDGTVLGVSGQRASLADCPVGRFCSPSDVLTLYLDPAQVPWGHLNQVDFTGGGYRTIAPGTRPLACGDIKPGVTAEIGGRNWYRSGTVLQSAPYEFPTDTMFPCMIVADIPVQSGDSGGAVLVNGLPAGITSREINGLLGFTPLKEGLDNLGLTLCDEPNCGLTPPAAGSGPGSPAPSGG